jgi:MoaA/NifB/PqqE/SkfB family radical SAM enzyme
MKLEYVNSTKENWFLVTWDLGNKCNYRCSYCPSMFNDGSTGWPEWEIVKKFVDEINKQLPDKEICFRISGGEPTYWKHFIEFASYVKSHGNYFSFLSNGSRDINYFKDISDYVDGLILSYHPEYSNKEHFAKVSESVNCPTVINLMITPDNFKEMTKVADYLYNNSSAAVWPKVVLDKITMSNDVAPYTTEQKTAINNWPYFKKLNDSKVHRGGLLLDGDPITANDLILQERNKHFGWTCWSGIDQINISFEGNVYRADCQVGGKLGNLENFKLPSRPQICNKNSCNCLSDIYIRKSNE